MSVDDEMAVVEQRLGAHLQGYTAMLREYAARLRAVLPPTPLTDAFRAARQRLDGSYVCAFCERVVYDQEFGGQLKRCGHCGAREAG